MAAGVSGRAPIEPRRRRTRLPRLLAVTCLLAVAASCSVRTQSDPEVIDKREVPFGLANDEAPDTDAPTSTQGQDFAVYLLGPGGAVTRTVRTGDGAATPARSLRSLLRGATDVETAFGLGSAIPSGTTLRSVAVKGDLATVDLEGALDRAVGADRIDALAQIVYTLTELPPIARVRFELDGEPIEVPTRDGELTSRPVTRADYALEGASSITRP